MIGTLKSRLSDVLNNSDLWLSVLIKIGALLASLVLSILITRIFGADTLGEWSYWTRLGIILSLLSLCGLPPILTRNLSLLLSKKKELKAHGLFEDAKSTTAVVYSLVLAIVFLLSRSGISPLKPINAQVFVFLVSFLFVSRNKILSSAFYARNQAWKGNVLDGLMPNLLFLGALWIALLSYDDMTIGGLFLLMLIARFITLMVGQSMLQWRIPEKKFSFLEPKLLYEGALLFLPTSISTFAVGLFVTVVGADFNLYYIGVFTVMMRLSFLPRVILEAVNSVYLSRVTVSLSGGSLEGPLKRKIVEPFILSFLGALAACLILLALEVQLLSLWDASFVEFGYGYRFMVVAGAVGVALGPSTILLVAMGDARFLMWSSSICMALLLGYGMNHDLAFRGFVELFCSYLIIDIFVKFIRVIWKISLLRPQSSVS